MPKSTKFSMAWSTPIAICVPPGAPSASTGRPRSKMMVGHRELKRDFPGSIEPVRPGRGSKTAMHPLYMNPSPGVMTPDIMPSEWVMVTMPPRASATQRWVVPDDSGSASRSTWLLPPSAMNAARWAA